MKAPAFWVGPEPSALARLLRPIGALFGAATAHRMSGRGERVAAKVVSVGNYVAGGAGKTPTAIAIARILARKGAPVAFLSRGYRGRARATPIRVDPSSHNVGDVGDEPLLLAAVAPCFVGADRATSARAAIHAGAEVLILDDGLQNPALSKDLSLCVVDGEYGRGNGLCIPAGPLRAPIARQARYIDALVVIGGDDAAVRRIASESPGKPLIRASLEPDAVVAAQLIGRDVLAFSGIARPEKFVATLARIGARVAARRDFGDHHLYSAREIETLKSEAARNHLLLATTEKDFIRLASSDRDGIIALPVALRFDDPAAFGALLDRSLGARRRGRSDRLTD
jgi:tetraacyldisaccharide 4'-kinase